MAETLTEQRTEQDGGAVEIGVRRTATDGAVEIPVEVEPEPASIKALSDLVKRVDAIDEALEPKDPFADNRFDDVDDTITDLRQEVEQRVPATAFRETINGLDSRIRDLDTRIGALADAFGAFKAEAEARVVNRKPLTERLDAIEKTLESFVERRTAHTDPKAWVGKYLKHGPSVPGTDVKPLVYTPTGTTIALYFYDNYSGSASYVSVKDQKRYLISASAETSQIDLCRDLGYLPPKEG